MLAAILAAALTVDGGTPELFSPVVLDVHHAELWLTKPDGGASDAPLAVQGGVWEDTPTAVWVAQNKARCCARAEEAERQAKSGEVDVRGYLLVGGVMLSVGAILGAVLAVAALGER